MSTFAAIVLSAGRSSRLPRFKPLLKLGGQTLVARAAKLFRQAGVEELIVVTGNRTDEVSSEARVNGMRPVFNPRYDDGMYSSVVTGLRALTPGFEAVFILPVDIPLVRASTVLGLVRAWEGTEAQALLPTFRGQPGHPPLIRAQAVPHIVGWNGPGGLAGALAMMLCEQLPVADAQILFDVDHEADFAEAEARFTRLDIPTRQEAQALLDIHTAGERGHGHAQGVAQAALALGRALIARGYGLDLELIETAALLHDIAKGQPQHEKAGGEILAELGFPAVAEIVAAHRDIDPATLVVPTERELVYLADKLVRGAQRVSIMQRFQEKLDYYSQNEDACRAIRMRREHAMSMQKLIEDCVGKPLSAILP